jgi:hypothetical protein
MKALIVGIFSVTATLAAQNPPSCAAIVKLQYGDSKIMEILTAWDRCRAKWKPETADADLNRYIRELSLLPVDVLRQKWLLFTGFAYQRRIQEVYVTRLLDAGSSLSDLPSIESHINRLTYDRALIEQSGRAAALTAELHRLGMLRLQRQIERAAQSGEIETFLALGAQASGTPLEPLYESMREQVYAQVWRTATKGASLAGICRHLSDRQDQTDCEAKRGRLESQERLDKVRNAPLGDLLTYKSSFENTEFEAEFNRLLRNRLWDCAAGACNTAEELAAACPNLANFADVAAARQCRVRLGELTLGKAHSARNTGNLDWPLVWQAVERCKELPCAVQASELEFAFTRASVVGRIEREEGARPTVAKQGWGTMLADLNQQARRFGKTLNDIAPELANRLDFHFHQAESMSFSLLKRVRSNLDALHGRVYRQTKEASIREIDNLESDLEYAAGLDAHETWPPQLRDEIGELRQRVITGDPYLKSGVHVAAPKSNYWFITIDKGVEVLLGLDPEPVTRWALLVAWEVIKNIVIGREDVTGYKLVAALPSRRQYMAVV